MRLTNELSVVKLYRGVGVNVVNYPCIDALIAKHFTQLGLPNIRTGSSVVFASTCLKQAADYAQPSKYPRLFEVIPQPGSVLHFCPGVVDAVTFFENYLNTQRHYLSGNSDWLLRDIQGDIGTLEVYASRKRCIKKILGYIAACFKRNCMISIPIEEGMKVPDTLLTHQGEVWINGTPPLLIPCEELSEQSSLTTADVISA